MRIVAGRWRGRPLATPAGQATRPTAERAREALFSMLVSRLGDFEGLAVADLFAGSGALGLEALSRGAASCVFVENDRAAIAAIRSNIARLGAEAQAELRPVAVETLGPAPRPCDLLLLDPPYESNFAVPVLERLLRLGWLAPGGWATVETARGAPVAPDGFSVEAERTYGKARITLLRDARA
jgi:16S rRNA (guanine966-N2)-methyltransferase